jgi:hypothetical protein
MNKNKLNINIIVYYLKGAREVREMIGTLGIAIKSKDYYCCIGMIIATSFTFYGRREASRSPYYQW